MHNPMIMVAPNGARRGKKDHANLPVTIEETVAASKQCNLAGAQALHLHVRDETGKHSLDHGRYKDALAALNDVVPAMRAQISTEAAGVYDVAQQLNCLQKVRPYWASISVREIAREPELADKVYGTCFETGTEVQHILYNAEDARLLARWQAHGVVRDAVPSLLFVLGHPNVSGGLTWNALLSSVSSLPASTSWMLCAFGRTEHARLIEAARLGGDCRVGFENSLTDPDERAWSDNAASVAALMAALAKERTHVPHLSA